MKSILQLENKMSLERRVKTLFSVPCSIDIYVRVCIYVDTGLYTASMQVPRVGSMRGCKRQGN